MNLWYLHLLTILFIGLKLTDHIDWAWGYVLAPSITGFAMNFIIVLAAIIFVAKR